MEVVSGLLSRADLPRFYSQDEYEEENVLEEPDIAPEVDEEFDPYELSEDFDLMEQIVRQQFNTAEEPRPTKKLKTTYEESPGQSFDLSPSS